MSGNPLRKLEAAPLYAQLGRLIESTPELAIAVPGQAGHYQPLTADEMLWLGRAEALVSEALGLAGTAEFKTIMQNFNQYRTWASAEISTILFRALAQIELELPTPPSGAFVPAGNAFDALKAVQRIFATATADLLVVDPYLDVKFLTDFAELTPDGVSLRALADASGKISTLVSPMVAWRKQHGATKPIEIRVAERRTLHDRLIASDHARVWTVGQSFNALAARAPTSFVEADKETALLKMSAYERIWADSSSLTNLE